MLTLLRSLDDADWDRPTDCTAWTVRSVVAHLVGALEDGAKVRTFARHAILSRVRHRRLSFLDGLNEAQLDDRRGWPGLRLVDAFARLAPAAVRGRRRTPGLMCRVKLPAFTSLPPGSTVSYLYDVVYARDVFMHRVDIARATSRPLPPATSDGDVVAQVLRDLDLRWQGPPLVLELTGATEGSWRLGDGEAVATVRVDAVELMRLLSGRPASPSYDVIGDQAGAQALDRARVTF